MANTIIPIYSTRGDADAFLVFPYLYNRTGEWIGFVTPKREVYSVLGYYVGFLTNDPRILRKRSGEDKPRLKPPPRPVRLRVPTNNPLPKMMSDVPFEMRDVLQDEPELLHTLDTGEMLQDMD
jgi:hypothetical protein